MSRTIKFAKAGGPEVLEFVETEVPAPGPTEVRITVKAIGINRAEAMWRADAYIEPVKFPAGLGYEAAGIVDAVGSDVTSFTPGDKVNTIPSFSMNQYHTYGEVIIAPEHAVVKHPESLSYAEAASVWMMYVTAYGALIEDAKVGKGDFVIIPAASSSVGLAAIQIANYAGATSIATTRTADKKQQLLDAGAAHVIVTDETGLVEKIMRITGGQGARVVIPAPRVQRTCDKPDQDNDRHPGCSWPDTQMTQLLPCPQPAADAEDPDEQRHRIGVRASAGDEGGIGGRRGLGEEKSEGGRETRWS